MPFFEYPELAIVQICWLLVAGIWLLRRNDEIPLLIAFLLFYVTGYRYWAVTSGLNDWVNLSQFGVSYFTKPEALSALSYLVLGESCLLGTYLWTQRRQIPIVNPTAFSPFLTQLRPKIIVFGFLCIPLVLIVRNSVANQVRAGRSLAFQVSGYLYQFPFVLIGIATLIMCLWKFGGMPKLWHKTVAIIILLSVSSLTFQISGRFQLIGWLATMAIIFTSSFKPERRLWLLGGFLLLSSSIFAIAGALRGYGGTGELQQAALTRFIGAEDANMLDGFMLLKRFIPNSVPYRFGMTHVGILLRPIPRALWPGKPTAGDGYMSQMGLYDANSGFTLGISPTLFGDFYSEGGTIAIVLLAVIYGFLLARLIRWTVWLHPFAGVLVRAMVCAALVPILRGGDIAGVVAWLGMAFWPCLLVLWFRRREFDLKAQYRRWQYSSMDANPPKNIE